MELTEGYKQTEIGIIPEEWEPIPLGTLFGFKNGLNKAKEFFGYGTPIVNYMDVFQNAGLRLIDVQGQVDVNRNELKAYEVRQGDVFFTRTSETVEEIGITSVMLDEPKDTVFSGFVLRARPIGDELEDEFKKYCFSAPYFRQQVISRASYTTRALTNGRSLSSALLARPPVPEQKAIAAALSDADALIAALDRLVAKKRDLKQGTMQQLLTGSTQLPGFSGKWEKLPLARIGRWYGGGTPRMSVKGYWTNGTIPWASSADIKTTRLATTANNITETAVSGSSTTVVPKGSILIVTRSGILRRYLPIAITENPIAINQDIKALVTMKDFDSDFIFHSLVANGPKILNAHMKSGTTVESVDLSGLKKFSIFLPIDKREQTAVASALSDMDTEIAALEAKRDKALAIKQGMMQVLLTGRIRLI